MKAAIFRLDNPAMPFALEVYLNVQDEKLSLHPENFYNDQKIELSKPPQAQEWKSILSMFPFTNQIKFAEYFHRVQGHLSQQESECLLEGYGMKPTKIKAKEMFRMAGLSLILKKIFLEKNISSDLLFLLSRVDDAHLKELSDSLLKPYIKRNIAKEVFELFLDLNQADRSACLKEIKNINQRISEDGLHFLNQHYRNILHSLRFPNREAMKRKVNSVIKQIPANSQTFKIKYDESFEKDSFMIEANIRSEKDIHDLQTSLKDPQCAASLKEILKVLNSPW